VEFTRQIDSGEITSGYASFRTGGVVSPETHSAAADAAHAAGAKFDKRHPDPSSVHEWIEMGRPTEVKP
ncbi:MAG: hypothetical protein M3526_01625, partial [Actinomycetota bacterium]|nr:hypothetical protein [Actinomycetota bacterium]